MLDFFCGFESFNLFEVTSASINYRIFFGGSWVFFCADRMLRIYVFPRQTFQGKLGLTIETLNVYIKICLVRVNVATT